MRPHRRSWRAVLACRGLLASALLLGSLVLGPRDAEAVTLVPFDSPVQPYQSWADRARVPTVSASVDFYLRSDSTCPDGRASCAGDLPLRIFLGDGGRWTLYHELGHIFDYVVMGAGADPSAVSAWRQQFLFIRRDPRGWREGVNPPVEQFAQAYMFCAMNPRRLPGGSRERFIWDYGYAGTTKRQHRRSCKLIYRAWQSEGG